MIGDNIYSAIVLLTEIENYHVYIRYSYVDLQMIFKEKFEV